MVSGRALKIVVAFVCRIVSVDSPYEVTLCAMIEIERNRKKDLNVKKAIMNEGTPNFRLRGLLS
jgi:hypothetical protein